MSAQENTLSLNPGSGKVLIEKSFFVSKSINRFYNLSINTLVVSLHVVDTYFIVSKDTKIFLSKGITSDRVEFSFYNVRVAE